MTVVKAYQTSKGTFLSLEEANKKKNRAKEYDGRDGGCVGREDPKEIYLLCDHNMYFQLTPIEIKESSYDKCGDCSDKDWCEYAKDPDIKECPLADLP